MSRSYAISRSLSADLRFFEDCVVLDMVIDEVCVSCRISAKQPHGGSPGASGMARDPWPHVFVSVSHVVSF